MPLLSATCKQANSALENLLQWEKNRRLPREVAAVLAALGFSERAQINFADFTDAQWKTTLAFTDRAGLTLILGARFREFLPGWVRERIERNLAGNTERLLRLRSALGEIARLFASRRIEYLLLKGFSQDAGYVADPRLRMSGDLDLFTPRDSLIPGRDALCSLGFEALQGTEQLPTDHLPPMLRKTGWQWREDFFDPEIPPAVDLHFQFWNVSTERIEAPGIHAFWDRRIEQDGIPMLHPADRLGYAALHLLRHLLRSSVRVYHVYELAYFLEGHAGNDEFWDSWRTLHAEPLRRLEAISFRLAIQWFDCRVAPALREEIDCLSGGIPSWFDHYAASPLEALFHPNKHELWLHFALLDSARDRRSVFFRRVVPLTMPGPVDAVFVPEHLMTWRLRVRKRVKYVAHLIERTTHHTRTLPLTFWHGLLWKHWGSGLTTSFWVFLSAASLYNLGLSVFFLLYNLYLLDRGYREDFLGAVTSALTIGSIAGVLPAASLVRRFGLKRTLLVCFTVNSIALMSRSLISGVPGLLVSAFASGAVGCVWAVCISPAVAALTSERARPTAFSIIFGSGIGLGVLAGMIGGRLPGWVARADITTSPAQSKQIVLLAASAFALLALWPLARLKIDSPPSREKRTYPTDRFIARFLVAIGVWSLATGLFNPLFNAYFSRQFHMPVERIGMVFSISQAAQVSAILAAPLVLLRLGLTRGVAVMQIATAIALALMVPAPAAVLAAALYAAFMSFQYMSEPGIYSSLMNRVAPEQRGGASALNFLVIFVAQAVAATVAGAIVARFGYAPMLMGASAIAAMAAVLFWRLPKPAPPAA